MRSGKSGYGFKPTVKVTKNKKYYPYKIKTIQGKRIKEHRWIMQEYLGRILNKEEFIHHMNGDTHDNRIENLMIVTNRTHGEIEFSLNERIFH
jgi:hypothetical protein